MKRKKKLIHLAKKLRSWLRDNILERYDNFEYWDRDLIESFCIEIGLEEDEEEALMKLLE